MCISYIFEEKAHDEAYLKTYWLAGILTICCKGQLFQHQCLEWMPFVAHTDNLTCYTIDWKSGYVVAERIVLTIVTPMFHMHKVLRSMPKASSSKELQKQKRSS